MPVSTLAWRQRKKKLWRGPLNKPCFHNSKIPNSFDSLKQCSQTTPFVFHHFYNSLKLKSQHRIPVCVCVHTYKLPQQTDFLGLLVSDGAIFFYFLCFEKISLTPKIDLNLCSSTLNSTPLLAFLYYSEDIHGLMKNTDNKGLQLCCCSSIIRQTLLPYLFQLRGGKNNL